MYQEDSQRKDISSQENKKEMSTVKMDVDRKHGKEWIKIARLC